MSDLPFKVGERVYLRLAPDATGTVSRVADEGFTVTWDDEERKPGERRIRHAMKWQWLHLFAKGNPPVPKADEKRGTDNG